MKKQASFKEYTVTIADSGSVEVFKSYDNVIGALREIYEANHVAYDSGWNTRRMGSNLIKEFGDDDSIVIIGEYIISKEQSGSIAVGKIYGNTLGALREIAEMINFTIDAKWNTRQTGSKVIDAIKNMN